MEDVDLAAKVKCPRCGSELVSGNGTSCLTCGVAWHYCYVANRVVWSHPKDKCLEECTRLVGEAIDEIERRENMELDYSSF